MPASRPPQTATASTTPRRRAHLVPSKERPRGHALSPPGRTPLQQHLDFFDLNKDGRIMPWETFMALRTLKFGWEPLNSLAAFWVALWLHAAFAWPSQGRWLPHPLWPIVTANAATTLHGCSSGSLNHDGHFVPSRFEALWERWDPAGSGRLRLADVLRMLWHDSSWRNPLGTFLSVFQWLLTWWLFADDNGCLRKSDVRGLYDGTSFYRLADRNGHPWSGMALRRDAVAKHKMG